MKEAPQPYIRESMLNPLPVSCTRAVFSVSAMFNSKLRLLCMSRTQGSQELGLTNESGLHQNGLFQM